MANDYYISAGIVPIDNSAGATAQSYYISAGLVPTDTAAGGRTTYNTDEESHGIAIGMGLRLNRGGE